MEWFLDRSDPSAVAAIRREIGAYLARHAEDPDAAYAGEVVVSELIANAFEHGRGAVWVSLGWEQRLPRLEVHDLGDSFRLDVDLPRDALAAGGRGLVLASDLTQHLSLAAKRAGGKTVAAELDVPRTVEADLDRPRSRSTTLPHPAEAGPDGFGREAFLRALVVQLAWAVDVDQGPAAAQAAVAQVGADVGWRMEEEYRRARDVVGRLDPERIADCYVRLKHAIDGDFYVVEATEERVVLGNRRCPFGESVSLAPALCRMTSSVFGGIAARSHGEATVVLEERIAVGDPECRVVVHLGAAPDEAATVGHRYTAAPDLDLDLPRDTRGRVRAPGPRKATDARTDGGTRQGS